jgi:hypothetical protein
MIQRIQTIYLLAALILIALCFFIPVAVISVPDGQIFTFDINGFRLITQNSSEYINKPVAIFISGLLISLLYLLIIFSYKNRPLQMRLCIYTLVFSLGLGFMLYWLLHQVQKEQGAEIMYKIGMVFPVISAILSFLAYRAIKKDDELVKSYDRLR